MKRHMRLAVSVCAAALLVVLVGCGGNAPYAPVITEGGKPDFTLTAEKTTLETTEDTSIFGLVLTSINGFDSKVTLSAEGIPSKFSETFKPAQIVPLPGGAAVDLEIYASGAPPGIYKFTVVATGGGLTKRLNCQLRITGLNVTVAPETQDLTYDGSIDYTVTVTPLGGHKGPVGLTVTNLPVFAHGSFSANSVDVTTGAKTVQLTISDGGGNSAAPGGRSDVYAFQVNADGGGAHDTQLAYFRYVVEGGVAATIK